MKKKSIAAVACMLLTAFITTFVYAAANDWPAIAPAQKERKCVLSIQKGDTVEFSSIDLERRMGIEVGSLKSIALTALPGAEQGTLKLTEKGKQVGITALRSFSREEIDRLVFEPLENVTQAAFTFIPACGDQTRTTLSVAVLDAPNNAPIAQSGRFETNRDIPIAGMLDVYDPDGDALTVQVMQKPQKGLLQVKDNMFHYEPYLGMTGSDRFTYCAVDDKGNYSREVAVNLSIQKMLDGITFVDMQQNPSLYAAVKLHEKGVLSGEKIGSISYFYPDRGVTRGEYVVMLASAYGLEGDLKACVNTGMRDDTAIPLWLKPYVQLAKEKKILTEDRFGANEVLSRAEAVVLTERTAKIPDVDTYNLQLPDIGEIPDWAMQSYMDLSAYKMLDLYDGSAHPTEGLTRSYAADLLWQLWKYKDAEGELTK